MAARCRNEGRDDADEIVVHVAGVTKSGGTGRHDGGNELIRLFEGRVHNVQPVCSDLREGSVVKDDLESQHISISVLRASYVLLNQHFVLTVSCLVDCCMAALLCRLAGCWETRCTSV
jgi:hypothetical protein